MRAYRRGPAVSHVVVRARWVAGAALALAGCGRTADAPIADASPGPRCAATQTKLVDPANFLGPGRGLPIDVGVSVALDVAVSGDSVFYVLHAGAADTIMRVSTAGGAPSLVATAADPFASFTPLGIVATPDALFYQVTSDSDDGGSFRTLMRVAPGGGTPHSVARLDGLVAPTASFAVDDHNVYYVDDQGTERMPLAGGAVQKVSDLRGDLAVVGAKLVIVDGAGNVYSVPAAGGPSTLLAQGQTNANSPLSCGDGDVCWLTSGQAPPGDSAWFLPADGGARVFLCGALDENCVFGSLVQLPAGGQPTTILTSRGFSPFHVAYDGSDFFLSAGGDASPGAIGKISGHGGLPVEVEDEGYGFAVDDACLYWANLDGVFSIAKSALPVAPDPEAGAPPGLCVMGDAAASPCDLGLGCTIPDAGLAGCTVCTQPDGGPVDCRDSGQAVACGAVGCGAGCACADTDAGVCSCGAP